MCYFGKDVYSIVGQRLKMGLRIQSMDTLYDLVIFGVLFLDILKNRELEVNLER